MPSLPHPTPGTNSESIISVIVTGCPPPPIPHFPSPSSIGPSLTSVTADFFQTSRPLFVPSVFGTASVKHLTYKNVQCFSPRMILVVIVLLIDKKLRHQKVFIKVAFKRVSTITLFSWSTNLHFYMFCHSGY